MNDLQAPWLGTWKAPWELGRGRRWGDWAWALAAIAQGWMLGGHEGRWPQVTWKMGKLRGPWVEAPPQDWRARPDPAWISLLRHGSVSVPPERRGRQEDELQTWCWQALLEGDGSPWMSLGSVRLNRPTREQWIASLGSVDSEGNLHLPPFLANLVPPSLFTLPSGWWAALLGSMDAEGRLLPEGTPPPELPWNELLAQGATVFRPLVISEPPPVILALEGTPWLHPLPGLGYVLAPTLRAWARGFGACPIALRELAPPSLALGDPPGSPIQELLQGTISTAVPFSAEWKACVQSDLEERAPTTAPPPSGDPTLDRLRMRWNGEPVPPTPGYPIWGTSAHPCGDPFHWMAEGRLAFRAHAIERALRAFTWAHAHFLRLGSALWAERAAANAATSAFFWGDLPGLTRWQEIQGPQPAPFRELNALTLLAARDEWDKALPLIRSLIAEHPYLEQPWIFLGQRGLDIGEAENVREALPNIANEEVQKLFSAYLEGFPTAPPPDLDPEFSLIWRHHLALRDPSEAEAFWSCWQSCINQPLRLGMGLALLERLPAERSAARLLDLQVLADRLDSERHQQRLQPLWPKSVARQVDAPASLLKEALQRRRHPSWLIWGGPDHPETLGFGAPAPEGTLSHLLRDGSLPPFEAQGRLWWGFPLHWEGGVVGHALTALDPQAPPDECADLHLLAPWLARLTPRIEPQPALQGGALLADGSEPMATVLRELTRVAPSELSILILGPTGSGKELTAREIHQRSGRSGPLVPVNCSAFAEGLLESELFGHVKGAFTGADRDRRGAIEAADKGTLFLDEVADLSPRLQSMFLRVLQEREVRRVGSDRAIHVNVRFLAATHRSLEGLAASGTFRRDLLYRLQGSILELPSLRERRHEFPYLVPRLLAQLAREGRHRYPDSAPGLAQALARLPWPGNFRELRHALERALLRCGEGPLKISHFPELQVPTALERTWEQATRDFQRRFLLDTLRQYRFRVAEAAENLGLTRPALYVAAKRMGLDLVAERERWSTESTE